LETSKKKSTLIKVRERIKRKKPNFRRQESWRYKRVKENWRKPQGIDSKMRKKVKGWPRSVNIGYRGPRKVRGIHPSGYFEILVSCPQDVDKANPETNAIRISHTVGAKKRAQISTMAAEKGIRVLNMKKEEEFEETTLDQQEAKET
jgi:large subunit ribosomal protein L32e